MGPGFRIQGRETGSWVQGLGYRVEGSGSWVQGLGYRVEGSGSWVQV